MLINTLEGQILPFEPKGYHGHIPIYNRKNIIRINITIFHIILYLLLL